MNTEMPVDLLHNLGFVEAVNIDPGNTRFVFVGEGLLDLLNRLKLQLLRIVFHQCDLDFVDFLFPGKHISARRFSQLFGVVAIMSRHDRPPG